MTKILSFVSSILSLAICIAICGCTDKSENNSIPAPETITIEESTLSHAPASVLDSMALNADDLNPQQAIDLLTGYVQIYRNSSSNRTKAVTMRKFVDVYDILISNYGDDFRNAVSQAANEETNLRDISQEFRSKLSGYDEASGMVYEPVTPKDTATSTTDSTIVVQN
ncbi:MAG: hypothetical protein K2O88_05580 [Paramuribaculum sp.]|nr:hypothetical protein [Paramuribaculum sp.]